MNTHELIVCLDTPAPESSVFSCPVELRGWFLLDDTTSEMPSVEILLEEHTSSRSPLRGGLLFAGKVLQSEKTDDGPWLESFEVRSSDRVVKLKGERAAGKVFDISASLNLGNFAPTEDLPSRLFTLALCCTLNTERTISNVTTFSAVPKSAACRALGGFLYPIEGPLESNVLLLEGWALKFGESVSSVQLEVDGKKLGTSRFGLPSPEQESQLPDLEGSSNCRFVSVLLASEFEEVIGRPDPTGQTINCKVRVRFCSGEELLIEAPPIVWNLERHPRGAQPYGVVEKISLAQSGAIRLEGWGINPGAGALSIELRSAKAKLSFVEGGTEGIALERFSRKDIWQQFPTLCQDEPCGFSFEVNPQVLGPAPGTICFALKDELSGQSSSLGPASMWGVFEHYVISKQGARTSLQKTLHKTRKAANSLRSCKSSELPASSMQKLDKVKRLLFVSHNLAPFEGAPRVLFDLVRAIREKFQPEAEICLVAGRDGGLSEDYERLGVRVEVIPELMIFDLSEKKYTRGLHRFLSLCQEVSPQIIFANVIDSFFAVDAAKRLGLPVLWTLHESVDPRFWFSELWPEMRLQVMHHLKQADKLLFVANSTRDLFTSLRGAGETAVIPNGLNLERVEAELEKRSKEEARAELGVSVDSFMMTCIGTTTRRKGQDVILDALPRVLQFLSPREVTLFLVGAREIDFLDELRKQIEDLGIAAHVEIVPETPKVSAYYIASDVMLVPSREESAPLVSLEAFAYGVPLVATSVFGLSEQLEHEKNALVVPVEDSEALARAIVRVAREPELSRRLVSKAKEIMRDKFSERSMLEKYWTEIEQATLRSVKESPY